MSNFTQPQLQYMKCVNRATIRMWEDILADLKFQSKFYFDLADPDDKENGEFAFNKLNEVRKEIRYIKQNLKSLRLIQKQVKKMLNANW